MTLFMMAYSYIVLTLGAIAALGALFCGIFVAAVLISAPFFVNSIVRDSSDLCGQAFLALFALVSGCFGAVCALAFTKWVLGL